MNRKKSGSTDGHLLYLPSGTHVSAKFRGAFCEAKIKSLTKNIRVQVQCKNDNTTITVSDEAIRGVLAIGSSVEVKLGDKKEYTAATIRRIQDMSQYLVDFDDGDEEILGRNSIVLKGKKSQSSVEQIGAGPSKPRRKSPDSDSMEPRKNKSLYKEKDAGKVVCVEETDRRKKGKDNWYPALVLCPSTQENADIDVEKEYLVRSFIDGSYYIVEKDEVEDLTKEVGSKVDSPTLKQAVEKAVAYMDREELPPHWDKHGIFGMDVDTDSEQEDDKRDRFVAELYSFWDRCSISVEGVPSIQKKQLDFYKFFRVVDKMGGYQRICHQKRWKDVAIKLGFEGNQHGNVKKAFIQYLLQYENMYRTLGVTLADVLPTGTVMHRSVTREGDKLAIGEIRGPAAAAGSRSFGNRYAAMGKQVVGKSSVVPEKKIVVKEEPLSSKKESIKKKKMEDDGKKVWNLFRKRKKTNLAYDSSTGEEGSNDEGSDAAMESDELDIEKIIGAPSPLVKKGRMLSRKEKSVKVGRVTKKPVEKKSKKIKSVAAISTLAKWTSQPKDSKPKMVEEAVSSPGTVVSTPFSPSDTLARGKSVVSGDEDAKSEHKIGVDALEKPYEASDRTVKVGDVLMVLHGLPKKAYEAKVLEMDKKGPHSRFFIHYTGWNSRHDEWIKLDRIANNLSFLQRREKIMKCMKKAYPQAVSFAQSTSASEPNTSGSTEKMKPKGKRYPKLAAGIPKPLVTSPEFQVVVKKETLPLEVAVKSVLKVKVEPLESVEAYRKAGLGKAAEAKSEETIKEKLRKRKKDMEEVREEGGDAKVKTVKRRNKSSLETKEELKGMGGTSSKEVKGKGKEVEEKTGLKGKTAKEMEGKSSKMGDGSRLPPMIRMCTGNKIKLISEPDNPGIGKKYASTLAAGMMDVDTITGNIHGTTFSAVESEAKVGGKIVEAAKKDEIMFDPVKVNVEPVRVYVEPSGEDAGPSEEGVKPPPVVETVVGAFTGMKMKMESSAVLTEMEAEAAMAAARKEIRMRNERKLMKRVTEVIGFVDLELMQDEEDGASEQTEENHSDKAGSESDEDMVTRLHIYDYDETDEVEIDREFKRIISIPSTSEVASGDVTAASSVPESIKIEGDQKLIKFSKQSSEKEEFPGVLVEEMPNISATDAVCRPSEVEALREVVAKEGVEMKRATSALDVALDVKIEKEVVKSDKDSAVEGDSALECRAGVEGHSKLGGDSALESHFQMAFRSASHAVAESFSNMEIRSSVKGNDEKISIREIPASSDSDDDDMKMVIDIEAMELADYGERMEGISQDVKVDEDVAMECEGEAEVIIEVGELNNKTEISGLKIVKTPVLMQESDEVVQVVQEPEVVKPGPFTEEAKEDVEISKVVKKDSVIQKRPEARPIAQQASGSNFFVDSNAGRAPPPVVGKMESATHKKPPAISTNVLEGLACGETIQRSPVMVEDAERPRASMADLEAQPGCSYANNEAQPGCSNANEDDKDKDGDVVDPKLAKMRELYYKRRLDASGRVKHCAAYERYLQAKWRHIDPVTKTPLPVSEEMEHPSIYTGQAILWREYYADIYEAAVLGVEPPERPNMPEPDEEMPQVDWNMYMESSIMENLTTDEKNELSKRVWDDYIIAYNILHSELQDVEKRLKYLKRREREGY